jgi:hypothetical protein
VFFFFLIFIHVVELADSRPHNLCRYAVPMLVNSTVQIRRQGKETNLLLLLARIKSAGLSHDDPGSMISFINLHESSIIMIACLVHNIFGLPGWLCPSLNSSNFFNLLDPWFAGTGFLFFHQFNSLPMNDELVTLVRHLKSFLQDHLYKSSSSSPSVASSAIGHFAEQSGGQWRLPTYQRDSIRQEVHRSTNNPAIEKIGF